MDKQKILEELANMGVEISLENGKPKINLSSKKSSQEAEKSIYDILFDYGQKIDWAKLNEYLKNLYGENKPTQKEPEKVEKTEYPPINIVEYENRYEFSIYATGYNKSEINVAIEKIDKNNVLTITGQPYEERPISSGYNRTIVTTNSKKTMLEFDLPGIEKPVKIIKKEWTKTPFKRTFKLNDDVDVSTIKAQFTNGVLTVYLYKTVIATTDRISIDIE